MFTTVIVLMILVSVLMVLIVLVQKSKGGGLNQSFASQTQVMGVRKSTDFVEKATWYLAAFMFVFSLLSVALLPDNSEVNGDSGLNQVIENKKIEKWNGELPRVQGGSGTIVDIGSVDNSSKGE